MKFADELRMLDRQPKPDKQKEAFDKKVNSIYQSIKSGCLRNVSKHSANGYIISAYDREYCQYGHEFRESLDVDNSALLSFPSYQLRKSGRYYSNIALFRAYNSNAYDGYEPVASTKAECDTFLMPLRELLVKDGFRIRELTSHAVRDEYDTVEMRGIISPKPYLVRHTTDTVIGYVVRFSVDW